MTPSSPSLLRALARASLGTPLRASVRRPLLAAPARWSSSCSSKPSTSTCAATQATPTCHSQPSTSNCSHSPAATHTATHSPTSSTFWSDAHTWRRAALNTTRCLIGCSIGDLGSMAYLMANYPDMNVGVSMGISMAAGITTSILLETVLLRVGADALPWKLAARTAVGMSMVSMLAMEFTENVVTLALGGAACEIGSPTFWGITALSMVAGFVVPLPYNYWRLRAYGKACH